MNELLARYFNAENLKKPDGLSQTQREAIVDLLNFCRIADAKLVAAEEVLSASEVAGFSWESSVPVVAYVADSLVRAQAVRELVEQRAFFIQSIAERLVTTEIKTQAIVFCQSMFMADGAFTHDERAVFKEIKAALGWAL